MASSAGREGVGPRVPEQLLRCFHDVFASGRYGPAVDAALKAFCGLTAAALALFIGVQILGDRRARKGGA